MTKIESNISLLALNTFHINVKATHFVELNDLRQTEAFFLSKRALQENHLILGGGSNLLFTKDFNGLVIKNSLKGIELLEENTKQVKVRAFAGENWHQFVMYCIDNNWAGLENLSLIPGNIGASPMQNIGAYGVEVKDFIDQVEAIRIRDGKEVVFDNSECEFDYRSSIFKTSAKNDYFIKAVSFKLSKEADIQLSYGSIQYELAKMGIDKPGIREVSEAVCSIRKSKLPDPNEIGNAGSFFKNPIVDAQLAQNIKAAHSDAPVYPIDDKNAKIAAGWLIEKCGWKGFRRNDCGVHEKQALVLVNYGHSSGSEIYQLSQEILDSVKNKFGIQLEREVNIV